MANAPALPLCDLVLEGRLDQEMILEMRDYVKEVIRNRPVLVLVDVSAVVQVTASGVVGILELRRLTRGRGGDVRLHGLSGAMAAAQTATQLTLVSRVYGDREAAVEAGSRVPVQVDRSSVRRQERRGSSAMARARVRAMTRTRRPVQEIESPVPVGAPSMHPLTWLDEPAPQPDPGHQVARSGSQLAADPDTR